MSAPACLSKHNVRTPQRRLSVSNLTVCAHFLSSCCLFVSLCLSAEFLSLPRTRAYVYMLFISGERERDEGKHLPRTSGTNRNSPEHAPLTRSFSVCVSLSPPRGTAACVCGVPQGLQGSGRAVAGQASRSGQGLAPAPSPPLEVRDVHLPFSFGAPRASSSSSSLFSLFSFFPSSLPTSFLVVSLSSHLLLCLSLFCSFKQTGALHLCHRRVLLRLPRNARDSHAPLSFFLVDCVRQNCRSWMRRCGTLRFFSREVLKIQHESRFSLLCSFSLAIRVYVPS